ncbi:MAG: UDP-N-acetylglucosamine 2-epimerase [Rhodospirillales bacterium]
MRKIAVITGSRADYSLISVLARAIEDDPDMALSLMACGSHFSERHGATWREIEADGFKITARIEMEPPTDSAADAARAAGRGVAGFADAFEKNRPDIAAVLGDRYEMLAAATAAMIMNIPVAHFGGGQVTENVIDERIRHALTKIAALHFTLVEPCRQRLIRMGERPETVHTIGAFGVDAIRGAEIRTRAETCARLGLEGEGPYLIITLHPETAGGADPARDAAEMLAALDSVKDARLVFTGQNADPGADAIGRAVGAYVSANPGRAALHASLGRDMYYSALAHAEAMVGNSSSAVNEAPSFKLGAVNIGGRQKGRIRADNVIDCPADRAACAAAVARARSAPFRASLETLENPFGDGSAGRRAAEILKAADPAGLSVKPFYDPPGAEAV